MFSLKKKQVTNEQAAGKKIRLVQVDDVQAANRAEKSLRFLALATDGNDPEALLESLYIAKLLKRNHPGAHLSILAHRAHYRFLRRTGVFDRIHFVREEKTSAWRRARQIARINPELVFSARPDSRESRALWLSGVRYKLGGFRNSTLARFFRWFDVSNSADLQRLAGKDIQLAPEGGRLALPTVAADEIIGSDRTSSRADLAALFAGEPYVFFRFPEKGPGWPLSYIPRLARLCQSSGLRLVVQFPGALVTDDQDYLRQEAAETVQLDGLGTQHLIEVISQAEAVVGSGAAEKILAEMLGRPVVLLRSTEDSEELAFDSEEEMDQVLPLRGSEGDLSLLDRIKTRAQLLHAHNEGSAMDLDSISPELLAETLRQSLDA